MKRPPRKCLDCGGAVEWKQRRCAPCKTARRETRREEKKLEARERRKDPAYREAQRLGSQRYRSENRERARESNRRSNRKSYVRRTYGLTLADVEEAKRRQDGKCAICRRDAALHIDHDHETGEYRGLLCIKCNMALGLFCDSPELMLKAIDYLTNSRLQPKAA